MLPPSTPPDEKPKIQVSPWSMTSSVLALLCGATVSRMRRGPPFDWRTSTLIGIVLSLDDRHPRHDVGIGEGERHPEAQQRARDDEEQGRQRGE